MKCQEGWTGQVLLCGLTCTTQYRSWPRVTEQQNCLLCAFIPIVVIHKVGVVVINPSFIHKSSETITMALSCTETLFPGKRKEVLLHRRLKAKRYSWDSFSGCPAMCHGKKNKVPVNSKSHHRQHREHKSIVHFRDSLLLTFKLSQYFYFPLSYRAHFQMPLKRF